MPWSDLDITLTKTSAQDYSEENRDLLEEAFQILKVFSKERSQLFKGIKCQTQRTHACFKTITQQGKWLSQNRYYN